MPADARPAEFVHVEVDACDACPDGLSMRFKASGEARAIERVQYESEDGLAGEWRIAAELDDDEAASGTRVSAVAREVEDSSAGLALLITGGRRGLRLVHAETGRVVLEAYLLLARTTPCS